MAKKVASPSSTQDSQSDSKKGNSSELKSMTGFGQSVQATPRVSLQVEIKTVNHRFLDIVCKLPREYSNAEMEIRALVQAALQRGRVEIAVQRTLAQNLDEAPLFDKDLFNTWYRALVDLLEEKGVLSGLAAAERASVLSRVALDVARRPEVIGAEVDKSTLETERNLIIAATTDALNKVQQMRVQEGVGVKKDLLARLGTIATIQNKLAQRSKELAATTRQRLVDRITALAPEVKLDEARLCSEVVFLTERADVSEELQRLGSHLQQFETTLNSVPNGKRFDFLLQEIGRELSTLGAKAQDAEMQQWVVEAKLEAEKLKEQAQNVE